MANEQNFEKDTSAAAREDVRMGEEEYPVVGENGLAGAQEDFAGDGAGETEASAQKTAPRSARRDILHLLCGGYLLYLTYQLAGSFLASSSGGWTATRIISLVGAGMFAVVGVSLLVGVIRRFVRRWKEKSQ